MIDMVRIGPALPGMCPFYKKDGKVHFDGQNYRRFDYGHSFDRNRGYCVAFKFQDSPAANTWDPESLLEWCGTVEPENTEVRDLLKIARRMAKQCIAMNKEWQFLACPCGGLDMTPKGRA